MHSTRHIRVVEWLNAVPLRFDKRGILTHLNKRGKHFVPFSLKKNVSVLSRLGKFARKSKYLRI